MSNTTLSISPQYGLPAVLPTNEAAVAINRAPQTLRRWACMEDGPIRPLRINGRLAWRVSDLQALLAGNPAAHVVEDHLAGKAQYNIGGLLCFPSEIPRRITNEIWTHLDIDIAIPWAIQSKQASNDIGAWLKWDGAFQAPSHLLKHCYVRPVVKQKIADLKADVNRLMHNQSMSIRGGKQSPSNRNNKWSKALDRISNHLKVINGDDNRTETSDISDLMG